MALPWYKNCDMSLQFNNVQNLAKLPIDNGTCLFVITKKSDDSEVVSGEMDFVVDSENNYRATIDKETSALVEEDEEYQIKVTFSDPDGDDDERYMDLYGALRR